MECRDGLAGAALWVLDARRRRQGVVRWARAGRGLFRSGARVEGVALANADALWRRLGAEIRDEAGDKLLLPV